MDETNWEYEYNRMVGSALKLNDIVNHLVAELEIRKGVAKVRQERIDKAIEYIESEYKLANENGYVIADYDKLVTVEDVYEDILEILKGSDKE